MAKKDNKDMNKDREIPKPSEILEAEEEVKGIVEIDFDGENTPIQNSTKEKKTRHRPITSPVSIIKPQKNPDLQEMDINDAKIVIEPQSLEDLEEELKDKLKLLEVLKQEKEQKRQQEEIKRQQKEQEEEIKRHQQAIEQQEKERKRVEQELIKQEEQEIEAIKKGIHEIQLMPYFEPFLKICPLCNSKIKKKKVKQTGLILTQSFECSNLYCNFHKEIVLQI